MKNNRTNKLVALITTSHTVYGLEEAISETQKRFDEEHKKKLEGQSSKSSDFYNTGNRTDRTANHYILTAHPYCFEFEKSELLLPVDEKHFIPAYVAAMINSLGHFDKIAVVGAPNKKTIVDIVRSHAKRAGLGELIFVPEATEYSVKQIQEERKSQPELKNGGVEFNLMRGWNALGRPDFVLQLAGDLPNITCREMQGLVKSAEGLKGSSRIAHIFANTKANSMALDFPRSFLPIKLGGLVRAEGECDGFRNYGKEGNAYLFSENLFEDPRNFMWVHMLYQSRKLFSREVRNGMKKQLPAAFRDAPRFAREIHRGNITAGAHPFHSLIWDIDSYNDLLLQYYQMWDKRDSQGYRLMAQVAGEIAGSEVVKSTIYQDYCDRLESHLREFNIPDVLMIEGKPRRTSVLYDRNAFRKHCIEKQD